jgi:hypothetical protein
VAHAGAFPHAPEHDTDSDADQATEHDTDSDRNIGINHTSSSKQQPAV